MERRNSLRFVTRVTLAACILVAALASSGHAQGRHHISFGLGYSKLMSDQLKDDLLGIDFTNAGNGGLAYRYSLTPAVDLSIDSDATVSMDSVLGVDLTLSNSFFGPGVRWYPMTTAPRPFVQANLFFVSERAEVEQGGVKVSDSEGGGGFGLFFGIDPQVSRLISIPVTAQYLYAKPADDISSLGINVAIAFNFGASR